VNSKPSIALPGQGVSPALTRQDLEGMVAQVLHGGRGLLLEDGQTFRFECQKTCNGCCRACDLMVMPHDVLRMSRRLGISTHEFLSRYTVLYPGSNSGMPVCILDRETWGGCPFVTPRGCSIYEDRISCCRNFPLGRLMDGNGSSYYFFQADVCPGCGQGREWTAAEWRAEQGMGPYQEENERFAALMERLMGIFLGQVPPPEVSLGLILGLYDFDTLAVRVAQGDGLGQMAASVNLMNLRNLMDGLAPGGDANYNLGQQFLQRVLLPAVESRFRKGSGGNSD
jgi:Fe-S-cluster containining protein